ncbi:DUF4097 family beta strand repeat protein [bacterium]|nr:DUF4097 family beta strand repeat protein [bacterium]
MKAKEIILLIFIIIGGVFLYHVQTGKIHFHWDWEEGFSPFEEDFVFEETEKIEPPFPSQMQVVNAHGNVHIEGTEEEIITIKLKKKIWRNRKENAEKVSQDLTLNIIRESSQIILTTNRDEFPKKNFRTHFTVTVPSEMSVKVRNAYGKVESSHVGPLDITNPHGEVEVSDIEGNLTLQNSYKDVQVTGVHSECQIETKYSSLRAQDISGDLRIRHRYGEIHLEKISGKVDIDGNNSEIIGNHLGGPVMIETSRKKVSLLDTGSAVIRGHHSPIEVRKVHKSLDIQDKYGRIHLEEIHGNLRVEGKSLEVYGKNIRGEKISIASSYKDVELEGFSGNTYIRLSHGDIILTPYPLTHPISAKGNYADITFNWPGKEKYPFEAQAEKGNLDWNLSAKLSYKKKNGVTLVKAFSEEKGKPSISLTTRYGTIKVIR